MYNNELAAYADFICFTGISMRGSHCDPSSMDRIEINDIQIPTCVGNLLKVEAILIVDNNAFFEFCDRNDVADFIQI